MLTLHICLYIRYSSLTSTSSRSKVTRNISFQSYWVAAAAAAATKTTGLAAAIIEYQPEIMVVARVLEFYDIFELAHV